MPRSAQLESTVVDEPSMSVVLGREKVHPLRHFLSASANRHLLPLLLLSAAIAVGQGLLYSTRIQVPYAPDTVQYIAAAQDILSHGHLVDPVRTPGYPLLLALIFAVRGAQDQQAVVVVQTFLTVVASFEIYLLVYWLTRKTFLACLVASIISLNLYILDWEFSVRSETLAYVMLITLFLIVERLLQRAHIWTLLAFVVVAFFTIMVRPFYVALPALLLVALAARSLWLHEGRARLIAWSCALALLYGGLVGYMALNWSLNGYFGISYIGTGNLFGKIIEYQMYDLPVSQELQPLQQDLIAYAEKGDPSPWPFVYDTKYSADYFAAPDQYSHYVILHYPVQFTGYTARDVITVWRADPVLYAQGSPNLPYTLMRLFSRLMLLLYLLFPLAVAGEVWRLRRSKADVRQYLLLMLSLGVLGALVTVATGGFVEFYRLRSPIDWAVIVVVFVAGYDFWITARRRVQAILSNKARPR
jgi:hypothetical protein